MKKKNLLLSLVIILGVVSGCGQDKSLILDNSSSPTTTDNSTSPIATTTTSSKTLSNEKPVITFENVFPDSAGKSLPKGIAIKKNGKAVQQLEYRPSMSLVAIKQTDKYAYFGFFDDKALNHMFNDQNPLILYRIDLQTNELKTIVESNTQIYYTQDISPDEKWVAGITQITGGKDIPKVFVQSTDNPSDVKTFMIDSYFTYAGNVRFSPNTKKIAFAAGAVLDNGRAQSAVYIIDLDTRSLTQIERTPRTRNAYFEVKGWKDSQTVNYILVENTPVLPSP